MIIELIGGPMDGVCMTLEDDSVSGVVIETPKNAQGFGVPFPFKKPDKWKYIILRSETTSGGRYKTQFVGKV